LSDGSIRDNDERAIIIAVESRRLSIDLQDSA
jgi:hypothetical protein